MKLIALFALLAVAACASAEDEPALVVKDRPAPHLPELHELFVGQLQEDKDGKIESIGQYVTDDTLSLGAIGIGIGIGTHFIPSCKLGPTVGNPICLAKCLTRGQDGGYCDGDTCKCV